jgi:hypothetical protein
MQDTELDPRQANGTRPEPPRVAVEWAAWILTAMRAAELAGQKPMHFSAWLAAAGREVQ